MQMPATAHDVLKRWSAHERGVIAGTPQSLFDGASEKHHVVGCRQGIGGFEHGFNLAGAQFNFQRQQWQTHILSRLFDDAQRRFCTVKPQLVEQVVARMNHADRGCGSWPCGLRRVCIVTVLGVLEFVNVKLNF